MRNELKAAPRTLLLRGRELYFPFAVRTLGEGHEYVGMAGLRQAKSEKRVRIMRGDGAPCGSGAFV